MSGGGEGRKSCERGDAVLMEVMEGGLCGQAVVGTGVRGRARWPQMIQRQIRV